MSDSVSKKQDQIVVHIHNHEEKKARKSKSPKIAKKDGKKEKKSVSPKVKPVKRSAESEEIVPEAKKEKKEPKPEKIYKPYSESFVKLLADIEKRDEEGQDPLKKEEIVAGLDKQSSEILLLKLADKAKLSRAERLCLVALNTVCAVKDLFKKGRMMGHRQDVYACKAKHTSGGLEVFDLKRNDRGRVVSVEASDKARVQWVANEPKRISAMIAFLQEKGYKIEAPAVLADSGSDDLAKDSRMEA